MEQIVEIVESGKALLHTRVYPRQPADSVIILHGGPGVPMDFDFIVEQLSRHYQIIIVDQRGTGFSPTGGGGYSVDEYIIDINSVAEHFGLNRFHLLGHGFGGLYAQLFAKKHPKQVKSMLLFSPISGTGKAWTQSMRELSRYHLKNGGLYRWLKMGVLKKFSNLGSDKACQSFYKVALQNFHLRFDRNYRVTDSEVAQVRSAVAKRTARNMCSYPEMSSKKDQKFAVTYVYGESDAFGKSREAAKKRFAGAEWINVPQAGHLVWLQNPEAVAEILMNFYHIRPLSKAG